MKRVFAPKRMMKRNLSKYSVLLIAAILIAGTASSLVWAAETAKPESATEITVYKSPSCGCCTQWVEHLQADGFEVQVETVNETYSIKSNLGVPPLLGSCHTAVVGDYWVEGHVPADLIRKLLEEKPADIKGLVVLGMVPGSPGMESPQAKKYQILRVDDEGLVSVYATREGNRGRSQ
jgi:hypothetical protein